MTFSRQEFQDLVEQLEEYADNHPTAYRWRIAGLAGLGYGYLFFIIALIGGLVVGMAALCFVSVVVAVKWLKLFGLPMAIGGWMVAKAMRVPMEAPEGRTLQRGEFPELFDQVDRIRDELGAPRVHEVVLTEEFNAAISQIPRLGMFGWPKNHLVLGLPLMQTLSPAEFESVLAHEFGHLSGNHGRFGAWVYRVRRTWGELKTSMEAGQGPPFLFGKFVDWFIPYFSAYSFVLARSEEYEADECAAEVAGAETAGRALAKVSVAGQYLGEEFFPDLERRNLVEPKAPEEFVSEMSDEIETALEEEPEVHLVRALNEETDLSDTHPSLSDRLEALGVEEPSVEETGGVSAAERFFGEQLPALTDHLNVNWFEQVRDRWRRMYEQAHQQRQYLEMLDQRHRAGGTLTPDEFWDYASLTEQFGDDETALARYRAFVDAHPEIGRGHCALGRMLVEQGDAEGIEHLERAMELDETLVDDAAVAMVGYHSEHGDEAEVERWLDRLEEFEHKRALARKERAAADPSDTFHPPDLDDEIREHVRQEVAHYEDVDEAYLVRKETEHFPDIPLYVLGIRHRMGPVTLAATEAVDGISEEVAFPGETLIYDLGDHHHGRRLRKALEDIEGAELQMDV